MKGWCASSGLGGAAIGRRLRTHDGAIEIVGVAKDAKYLTLAESPQPWIYRPLAQEPTDNPSLSLAVRVERDSLQLRQSIEREVRALAPAWPAFPFRTLDEGLDLQRLVPRLGAAVFGALGAFGLLLAAVGIYGVTAYVVKQRAREIGIRLALGSPARRVMALVIKQGMAVCLAGAALGLAIAFVAARFLSSVLVNTGAADPLTYFVVPALLVAVALLACYLPARVVTKANPLDALRHE